METKTFHLDFNDIIFEKDIYPRTGPYSKTTVQSYKEAINLGATFPPIVIQLVFNHIKDKPEEKEFLLLDGLHRLKVYEGEKVEEVEIVCYQEEPMDYVVERLNLKVIAHNLNKAHGDRISDKSSEALAVEIAEGDPGIALTEQAIADQIMCPRTTVSDWVKKIRASQRAGRDNVIIKLNRLGWIQQDIADTVGIDRGHVSKIVHSDDVVKMHNSISDGIGIDSIIETYEIDETLYWSLRLDKMTDQERFAELDWKIRVYDSWAFSKTDSRFGTPTWPGRIPARLIAHTLFYFTNEGDRVFDPMTGGGTTTDVCLAFGRKCDAYDLHHDPKKPEIRQHYWDLEDMQWPDAKKPDLLFFDPPYFDKMKDSYESLTQNGEVPVSSLENGDYMQFFEDFFLLAKKNSKKGTRMAFLNSDWRDYPGNSAMEEDDSLAITSVDYANLLKKCGWSVTHLIDTPLSSQQLNGYDVVKMQESRTIAVLRRTLIMSVLK